MMKRSVTKHFKRAFFIMPLLAAGLFVLVTCNVSKPTSIIFPSRVWVGTWSTAPQLAEPGNMPPRPYLSNNTLRQIVCVSLGRNGSFRDDPSLIMRQTGSIRVKPSG